jgi:hypothetical protein
MDNNKSEKLVQECVEAIGSIAGENNINIVDEDFVKDIALSSKFLNAAFERQLGQRNNLHEDMSKLMNSILK